ncbi:MAG: VOC family protein [Chitinophagaceae bacterium]
MEKIIKWLVVALMATIYLSASAQTSEKPMPILDHIAFYVKNIDRSARFYTRIFRLDTVSMPFKNAPVKWFIISPGVQLHLIQGAKKNVEVPELSHVCFSVQSLNRFIEMLKQNNIPFDDSQGNKNTVQKRPDGVSQIFVQDPDGYWIEVNDRVH